MDYIVLDLEWNNAFSKKLKKGINEIIEIGALRLNSRLRITDSFTQLIQPKLSRKIHARVEELTHITNQDVGGGIPFVQAVSNFRDWVGEKECIFLTWSDTDIHVLIENLRYFEALELLSFLRLYVDVQKYCQSFLNLPNNNQVSLAKAAELLGLEADQNSLHRALADCELTARCFAKTYQEEAFKKHIRICDDRFYARLFFHPYYIVDMQDENMDQNALRCSCPRCGVYARRCSPWVIRNQAFCANFQCSQCGEKYAYTTRVKKRFDHVEIKHSIRPLKKIPSVPSKQTGAPQKTKK